MHDMLTNDAGRTTGRNNTSVLVVVVGVGGWGGAEGEEDCWLT